jgi:superfamily II DNA/RNA helicase
MKLVRDRKLTVLVATDVAARGLDISSIRVVICYDAAGSIDTHTHRIGRTGRAGAKGDAFSLVTPEDVRFAGPLVHSLESSGQIVPKELLQIAMNDSRFRQNQKVTETQPALKFQKTENSKVESKFTLGTGEAGHLGKVVELPKNDKSDSSDDEEDLYAPGVSKPFGGIANRR